MRSERFAYKEEIQNALTPLAGDVGGLTLHTDNDGIYVYGKEGHQLILGVSGSGKSRRGTIPATRALIESKESFVCIDPKGELYKNTAWYAKDTHKICVINFRNPAQSQRWNPLAFPRALYNKGLKGLAQQMIQELVVNLTSDNFNSDRFWIDSERNLLSGVINLLIQYAPAQQCNFTEVLNIVTQDWLSLKHDDNTTVSGGYLQSIVEVLPIDCPAKQLLASYTNLSANTTRSCVLAEVMNTVSKFCATEDVKEMIAGDDLDIAHMDADKPFAIYVIIPDESAVFNALSGLLCSQITHRLIKLADTKYGGRLPIRVNFILEELGNIGHSIADLCFLMTASRSRNVRMTLVLQALSQLETIYGSSRAATILSNADVCCSFRTNDWATLTELSRKCGEKMIKAGEMRFAQALISESQLMALETGQALIFISGRTKYIEQFLDYTEMFDCEDLEDLPIPKIMHSEKYTPINLSELKNQIASRGKPNPKGSYYKSKLFSGGEQ